MARRLSGERPEDIKRRWLQERNAHSVQINGFGYFFPGRAKRSATRVPSPLRYVQYLPMGRTVRLLLLVAGPAYVALQILQGASVGRAIGLSLALMAAIGLVSTFRMAVGNHAVSFDIAGLRTVSSFTVVPLFAIRDARRGPAGEDWPRCPVRGGWWPGRSRVSVLHVDEGGAPAAFHVWVRDPGAFGTAVLGHPMD